MVRIAATEERVLNVPASPESVYAFFSRPEALSEAMGSVERCERLEGNRVRWLLEEKVDKGIRFRADYIVTFEGDGTEHVCWRSVEGNMRNDGDVWIKPLAGGGTEIHYRESRPIPALDRPRSLPLETDCSGFATLCYSWAGAPDPNGNGFSGEGYTGTMLATCRGDTRAPSNANSSASSPVCPAYLR